MWIKEKKKHFLYSFYLLLSSISLGRLLGPRKPSVTLVLSLHNNGGRNALQDIIRSSRRCNCETHSFATRHEFEDWWSPSPYVTTRSEPATAANAAVFVDRTDATVAQSIASYEAWRASIWRLDPTGWTFKITQFFEYHSTLDQERLTIVSFYMEG